MVGSVSVTEDPGSPLFAPGAIVADKYMIDGVLGRGGIGVVVAATHLHLDQKVAIKYLRCGAPRDRVVTDRFLREARLAAQIRSEHVVRVFDVATMSDGTPYMVMEHLEGVDLRQVLTEKGHIGLEQAVDWVLQVCEALVGAHTQGIVHRDLKPENLFLARQSGGRDILKILDFGISKLSERFASSSRVKQVTQAGDRMGTPLYMSPEQLAGDPNVDARTDVWAVGVVLYEFCTGMMPFEGDSLPALCTAVLTKTPVPVKTLRPELPAELDHIILGCLAKEPADRFGNIAELVQELAPFASATGQECVQQIVRTMREAGDSVRARRFTSWRRSLPRCPPTHVRCRRLRGIRAS
jgi:serine/threonine-protein kinase